MEGYEFFYADIEADYIFLSRYNVGDFIHANNGVVASRLKGGLLSNCNVRFTFVPQPQGFVNYRVEDEDWKNQQLFIFDKDWRFKVEDKFFYDGVFQILMSHIDWEDLGDTNNDLSKFLIMHNGNDVSVKCLVLMVRTAPIKVF